MIVELMTYQEIAKACAETVYPDVKNLISGMIKYRDSKKNIPRYLEQLLNKNHFIQSLLFEDGKILFDEFYISHKISSRRDRKTLTINNCKDLFATYRSISIVGEAGIGKSSFAKYIIRNSIKENFKIPFIIELRKYHETESFENIIKKEFEVFSQTNSTPIDFIHDSLSEGKFLIIFDGYDEVPSNDIPRLHTKLDRFSTKYSKCPMLILGRPYSHLESFLSFKLMELSSFEKEDVIKFIDNLKPHYDPEFITNLTKSINHNTYNHFKEYLKNPLLLSSFVISFKHHTSFVPEQLSSFYTEVIEALFFKHDRTTKNSFQRSLESGLTKEQIKTFLASFSLIMTQREIFEFSQSACESNFQKIKAKSNLNCEFENLKIDLLKSLALWIKDGMYYKFFHRSLQEYFFALAISELKSRKPEFYSSLLENKFANRMSNFSVRLELLNELDHDDFNKYLIIPFINKTLKGMEAKSPRQQATYLLDVLLKKSKFKVLQHNKRLLPLTMVQPNLTKIIIEHLLKRTNSTTLMKDIDKYIAMSLSNYAKENFKPNHDPEMASSIIPLTKESIPTINALDVDILAIKIEALLNHLKDAKEVITKAIEIDIFDEFIL